MGLGSVKVLYLYHRRENNSMIQGMYLVFSSFVIPSKSYKVEYNFISKPFLRDISCISHT